MLTIYHKLDPKLEGLLERAICMLSTHMEAIMATLDDLVTKVANIGTVEDSVVTLLADISARLKAAGQDQTKLDALAAAIDAQTTKLSDAVVANTPSA